MSGLTTFRDDDVGALSVDQVALAAGAFLLLSMLAYELFTAGADALLATVDPEATTLSAELDLASVEN